MEAEEIEEMLRQNGIELKENVNQHFLIDEGAVDIMIDSAEISKEDCILDIGAGTGIITERAAENARNVLAIEIDEDFKPILDKLPRNVEVLYDDALKILVHKKIRGFNKIIANIPYQTAEPLMRYLLTAKHVNNAVLIVPISFADKAIENPVYSAFLNIEIAAKLSADSFYPKPRTYSAIIKITRRQNYEEDRDSQAYVIRKLYCQGDKILKNALRDLLIDYYRLNKKEQLTKKKAKSKILSLGLSDEVLNQKVEGLHAEKYKEIAENISKE